MATKNHRTHTTASRTQPRKKRASKNFSAILERATESQPRSRRLFSRFIHLDAVYYASEFLASTIARPNAILCGAVVAFFATITAYLFAKNFGYSLSGFETVGGFIVGWTIGILFDIVARFVKKK